MSGVLRLEAVTKEYPRTGVALKPDVLPDADRRQLRAVEAGLHVIAACRSQAPERFQFLPTSWEGQPPHFDLLAGGPAVREGLIAGEPVRALVASWTADLAAFARTRQRHLHYA